MPAPCPSVWLRTWMGTGVAAAVPAGMGPSHRGGSGWAEPNCRGQAGLGSHGAPPARGSRCRTTGSSRVAPWHDQWGLGFAHSRVEVLLLGTSPRSWR